MRFALVFVLVGTMTALADDQPTAKEKVAIDLIIKYGGKGSLDPNLHAEARVLAKFEKATNLALSKIKNNPQIGGIDIFDASDCTFDGFSALKDLPHLHKFVIGKAKLKQQYVPAIGQYKELRYLALVNVDLTDKGLASLDKLTKLEHLTLSENPKITDEGMATVKGFSRLRVLYLSKTSITDKGLMELKVLDGLRTLGVGGTKVSEDAAEKFADDMPNLRSVMH